MANSPFTMPGFAPIGPMLAQTAESTQEALARLGGEAGVEWKLDGARIQVHRVDEEVRIFTRNLNDVTERLPAVVDAVRELPVGQVPLVAPAHPSKEGNSERVMVEVTTAVLRALAQRHDPHRAGRLAGDQRQVLVVGAVGVELVDRAQAGALRRHAAVFPQ
jgi:DNA ligase-1